MDVDGALNPHHGLTAVFAKVLGVKNDAEAVDAGPLPRNASEVSLGEWPDVLQYGDHVIQC
jgi:hypothetical protein